MAAEAERKQRERFQISMETRKGNSFKTWKHLQNTEGNVPPLEGRKRSVDSALFLQKSPGGRALPIFPAGFAGVTHSEVGAGSQDPFVSMRMDPATFP